MEALIGPQPYTERAKARPAAALIMGLALALVMGMSASPNAWAQGAESAVDVTHPSHPALVRLRAEASHPSIVTIRLARMIFGDGDKEKRLQTKLFLNRNLMIMSSQDIVAHRKYFIAIKVHPGFQALFEKAVVFKRNVETTTGGALFARGQSQLKAARQSKDGLTKRGYRTLGDALILWAAKGGHIEARYIVVLEEMSTVFNEEKQKDDEKRRARDGLSKKEIKKRRNLELRWVKDRQTSGLAALLALAREGYGPAQREVAQRFATGNMFPKNEIKAYYWMKRAAGHDAALSKRADALGQELSIWQRLKVRYWIFKGRVPDVATN